MVVGSSGKKQIGGSGLVGSVGSAEGINNSADLSISGKEGPPFTGSYLGQPASNLFPSDSAPSAADYKLQYGMLSP